MAVSSLSIEQFIPLSQQHLVVDVRSPSEFEHAHFPKAYSMPLFDDEERKIVGTIYKQQSRELAIKAGLDFFGGKMKDMVSRLEETLQQRHSKTVLVHCWRGGMRSASVAWLLDLYGFQVYTLAGGYKSFRNWALAQFERPYPLRILSGYTGSGKTEILHKLAQMGASVLDLEGMAGHKGSVFGHIGMAPQPGTEQFENRLALKLYELTLRQEDTRQPIWVESESSRIGNVHIHHVFFKQMAAAPRIHIDVPFDARLDKITREYGIAETADLAASVRRIQKRLGGLTAKRVLDYFDQEELKQAFALLLQHYYDKLYEKSILFQPPSLKIALTGTDARKNAQLILAQINKQHD